MHRKFGGVKGGESKQCVVDGANAAARCENDRQFEFDHHVEHELFAVDGHQHAAGSFDDQPIVGEAGRKVDATKIDFDAGPTRGKIGRNGRNEFIDFIESAIGANAGEAHDGDAVGAFECTGLDGLPVDSVESGAK